MEEEAVQVEARTRTRTHTHTHTHTIMNEDCEKEHNEKQEY